MRSSLRVVVLMTVAVTWGCMENAWTNEGALPDGGAFDSGSPQDGDRPLQDVSEANACDGFDNDGDGRVDEDCPCELGSTQPCFTGAEWRVIEGTPCEMGVQTCEGEPEFTGWGECVGDLLPGREVCWDGVDNNCDGAVDEGCQCSPGETRWCYEGPPGTQDVGICQAGVEECLGEGMGWSDCEGQVLPEEELYNDIDDDCDGEADEYVVPPPPVPVGCTAETLTHLVGARDCGENQAVYMVDDGDGPNMICCPLPAPDILSDDEPVAWGAVCGADEVITGAVGTFSFRCTRINTDRYQLATPQLPCYFGTGSSGAAGVVSCAGHPHSFTVLQQNYFGSDGCSGQPYGALFVSQQGDDCRDLRASQLQYNGLVEGDRAGAAVPMFAE